LGGAHFGTCRQLAFGQTVRAVLGKLFGTARLLGPARAERALVHLAAHAEGARLRKLRRAERTGVEAVTAADAHVLVVQHHAFAGLIEAVDRAYRHTGRIRAVHACDGNGFLARHALIHRHHSPPIDAPGHFVDVLARGHAAVALNAAFRVAEEFHSSHCLSPPGFDPRIARAVPR